MQFDRRSLLVGGSALATTLGSTLTLGALPPSASAEGTVIKFGAPQDFTKVYTFVTAEYSQGQRDCITLVNQRGGVGGIKIHLDVTDHGNDVERAIAVYERYKREGYLLVDPLSTPVGRALVTRALADKINLITTLSGRSDAADGKVFPYVMPLSPNYWSQAALILDYFQKQDGDLQGKRIVLVHIDTPFGREPIPILEVMSRGHGFALQALPYAPPGTDQAAVWQQVRAARPDWVIIWGAGIGQPTALVEAVRNELPLERLASCVWLSESDMDVVGRGTAKGVLKFEAAASGRRPKLIQEILNEVVLQDKGAGPEEKVGTTYYNIGVMMAAIMAEGVRRAFEKAPDGPHTGTWLNEGLTSITNFTANGLMPPITTSKEDHQGGGRGRIVRWDGTRFVPQTAWEAPYQDVVWAEIRKHSEEFMRSGR